MHLPVHPFTSYRMVSQAKTGCFGWEGPLRYTLMIASDLASALVNLVLRPLMAASFIVLHHDAKARAGTTGRDRRA